MPKIIITGPTCSGKSSLKNRLVNKGMKPIIQFTTRKIRDGEVDGKDYDYIKNSDSLPFLQANSITYHTYENGTTYGITNKEFNGGDVLAVGIKELEALPTKVLNKCIIIYIAGTPKTLLERLLKRGDREKEALRRLHSDSIDYAHFNWWDIRITNPEDFKI